LGWEGGDGCGGRGLDFVVRFGIKLRRGGVDYRGLDKELDY